MAMVFILRKFHLLINITIRRRPWNLMIYYLKNSRKNVMNSLKKVHSFTLEQMTLVALIAILKTFIL